MASHRASGGDGDDNGFEAHLPGYLVERNFASRELALEQLDDFAASSGFRLSIRSSTRLKTYLACCRARPPKGKDAKTTYTSYTKCPYSVKVVALTADADSVAVRQIHAHHNHPPFPEGYDEPWRKARPVKRARTHSTPPPPPPPPAAEPAEPTPPSSSSQTAQPTCAQRQDQRDRSLTPQPSRPPPVPPPPQPTHSPPPPPASAAPDDHAGCSVAASNATMGSNASAIRGLLRLSFDTPGPAPTTASKPTLLYEILRDPPYQTTSAEVSRLSRSEIRDALAWARLLVSSLELQDQFMQQQQDKHAK